MFADELPRGRAFEAHQQLASVRGGRVRLLWDELTPAPWWDAALRRAGG
ncbi:MAG: hypothetical protein ACRDPA_17695 [Solirubrobacteraceae bacterium]